MSFVKTHGIFLNGMFRYHWMSKSLIFAEIESCPFSHGIESIHFSAPCRKVAVRCFPKTIPNRNLPLITCGNQSLFNDLEPDSESMGILAKIGPGCLLCFFN